MTSNLKRHLKTHEDPLPYKVIQLSSYFLIFISNNLMYSAFCVKKHLPISSVQCMWKNLCHSIQYVNKILPHSNSNYLSSTVSIV